MLIKNSLSLLAAATISVALLSATPTALAAETTQPGTAPDEGTVEAPLAPDATDQTGPIVPAPAAKPQKPQLATVETGASRWKGRKLRHPRGGGFPQAVMRWANLAKAIMREKKIPKRYLRGVLAQIQQESSGNPFAVNNWDINARNGTPSKGLLQIIAPTYRAHAKPGHRHLKYQTVPYTNLWASMEYVLERYGMKKFRSWNRGYNHGY